MNRNDGRVSVKEFRLREGRRSERCDDKGDGSYKKGEGRSTSRGSKESGVEVPGQSYDTRECSKIEKREHVTKGVDLSCVRITVTNDRKGDLPFGGLLVME